ncbi:MAG: pyridoxamine 5'-phosphate oxidase family protein [Calditrichaceae bacterium]|nr:pyridoxamine 5'-phosphate oxidase family protein [Calditrichaceae bacterium]
MGYKLKREEILKFILENPIFSLATCADNQPYARMIMMYKADKENGIIFSTWKQKDLYHQLTFNPNVELCFYNTQQGKQLRIKGRVEILEDEFLKKKIGMKFQFLRPQIEKFGYDSMMVCRLKNGKATFWNMASAFDEKTYFNF